MSRLSFTSYGYSVAGNYKHEDAQIVAFHGDSFGADMEATVGRAARTSSGATTAFRGGVINGLLNTGYEVAMPFTSSNWGTDIDYYNLGGHGISVVDTIFPTGKVHIIGTSMGGFNACVWASTHINRVASLTLISPAVDMMAEYDLMAGNALLNPISEEFRFCIAGDKTADRATFESALNSMGASRTQLSTALLPIADKIFVVSCTNDVVVPVAGVQSFASELNLPPERAIFFDSGSASDRHPAPYRPSLGWDRLTTLRQVKANTSFNPYSLNWKAAGWASDLSLSNGNPVASWTGVGATPTQATSDYQPVWVASGINSKPVVQFDGNDDYLRDSSLTGISQRTNVIIGLARGGSNSCFIDGKDSSNRSLIYRDSGGDKWRLFASAVLAGGTSDNDVAHLFVGLFDGSSSRLDVDGTAVISGSAGTSGTDGLTLGRNALLTLDGRVDIAFWGVYDGDPTADANWSGFKAWVSDYYGIGVA